MVDDAFSIDKLKEGHMKVMRQLSNEDYIIQAKLADAIDGANPPSISKNANSLEQWELIARRKVGKNTKRCSLTAKGARVLELIQEIEGLVQPRPGQVVVQPGIIRDRVKEMRRPLDLKLGHNAVMRHIGAADALCSTEPITIVCQALEEEGSRGNARALLLEILGRLLAMAKEEGLLLVDDEGVKERVSTLLRGVLVPNGHIVGPDVCLFDWNKATEEDKPKLIEYLRQLGYEWPASDTAFFTLGCNTFEGRLEGWNEELDEANEVVFDEEAPVVTSDISILDYGKSIVFCRRVEDNTVYLRCRDEEYDFVARWEDGCLNVYENWMRADEMAAAYNAMRVLCSDGCNRCMFMLSLQALRPPADIYRSSKGATVFVDRIIADSIARDGMLKEICRNALFLYKRQCEEKLEKNTPSEECVMSLRNMIDCYEGKILSLDCAAS